MDNTVLNFSILSDKGLSAVTCANEEQAQLLIDEMFRQHRHLVDRLWWNENNRWYLYAPDTTYALHIFDTESDTMQVAPKHYWLEHGYKVFDFDSLVVSSTDLGVLPPQECDIEKWFGLEINNDC